MLYEVITDYQMYSVSRGNLQREHWVENNPVLRKMMSALTDDEQRAIKRGGQDPKKIFAAYELACRSEQKPTVILIKTVKGDGLGEAAQGRNTSHQKKQFTLAERQLRQAIRRSAGRRAHERPCGHGPDVDGRGRVV